MITFLGSVTKKAIKVPSYGAFKVESTEVDTGGDGVLDTLFKYDSIEGVSAKAHK